tara:strand:- start:6566 stop:7390 length:825 start_codon:yes stop_codon:yes gene_type:complete
MNTILIGEVIKKQRLLIKISISKVSEELHIPISVIENIENNDIDKSIDIVFFLGHLRSYAKFLGLDAEETVRDFKKQNFLQPKKSSEVLPKPIISNLDMLPYAKIFSLTSIVGIFLAFYFLFVDSDNLSKDFAITSDIPENLESLVEKTQIEIAKKEQIIKLQNEQDIKNNRDKSSIDAYAYSKNSDSYIENKIVTLKFTNSTWIQVRDTKDQIVLSKLMSNSDQYSYDLNSNYSITTGNAGNVLVVIDNKVLGKLGKIGEVIDSIVIDNNFKN